uniref:Uncharacterized protein n=1 Tax=Mus musculus TaxID=10090 RepID=Q8C8G0_MOUSE|nr:unnamed protein product [Mus musculus]
MSASDTPKSRFDTSSLAPVSTPSPPPQPLSNRSCCHLSGSGFGLLYGAGRFLPPRAMAGRFLLGPPPRFTRRWLRFSLMMSSKDMSILSAMAGADPGLTGPALAVQTRKYSNSMIPPP